METRSPEYETAEARGHPVHSAAIPDKQFSIIVITANRSEFLKSPKLCHVISMNTLIYGTPRMKPTDLQCWWIVSSVHRLESE
jgi:hypothetical protein